MYDLIERGYSRRESLREKQIWEIFKQVCEGVEACHREEPSIQHRDLKVENVLQNERGEFKLCDFGSASQTCYFPPFDERTRSLITNDVEKNTTLSYRSPEMIDLYRNHPITEKSDICLCSSSFLLSSSFLFSSSFPLSFSFFLFLFLFLFSIFSSFPLSSSNLLIHFYERGFGVHSLQACLFSSPFRRRLFPWNSKRKCQHSSPLFTIRRLSRLFLPSQLLFPTHFPHSFPLHSKPFFQTRHIPSITACLQCHQLHFLLHSSISLPFFS